MGYELPVFLATNAFLCSRKLLRNSGFFSTGGTFQRGMIFSGGSYKLIPSRGREKKLSAPVLEKFPNARLII